MEKRSESNGSSQKQQIEDVFIDKFHNAITGKDYRAKFSTMYLIQALAILLIGGFIGYLLGLPITTSQPWTIYLLLFLGLIVTCPIAAISSISMVKLIDKMLSSNLDEEKRRANT